MLQQTTNSTKVALYENLWGLLSIPSGIHDNEKDTGDIDQAESSLCAVGLHELLCGDFFKHEFPVPSNPATGRFHLHQRISFLVF